jgi:hypothetical protein
VSVGKPNRAWPGAFWFPVPQVILGFSDCLPGPWLCFPSRVSPSDMKPCFQKVLRALGCSCCFQSGLPSPRYKDLKMALLSLSVPVSLCLSVSQMAILLTASKKTLHSTVHMCPERFIELFELQPCPHPPAEDLSFQLIQKWHCFNPKELSTPVR